MKLGLGLYRHMLDRRHYDFAAQCGATDVVVHLVDYFNQGGHDANDQPVGGLKGWGIAGDPDKIWETADLLAIRRGIEDAGLRWHAIENFDPAHWHDILLDGPKRSYQIGQIQQMVRNAGEAGIPAIGYNFSIAGVAGRLVGQTARGNAEGVLMNGIDESCTAPIQVGMVWNMWHGKPGAGVLPPIDHAELWNRLERFLEDVLPVAEKAGVRLALHPDDPPLEFVRGQPRLVWQPAMYDRLLDISPSRSNAIELCLGTIAEMTGGDVLETADRYTKDNHAAYIHLRNVRGKVPFYRETFIDEGDIDVPEVMRILKRNQWDGVVIPDHAPRMSCDAPWHAGMAHALGYLKALMDTV
jgi:mannonate dehydratase